MKLILVALAVVLLVSEVHGFFSDFMGGRGNGGQGGWGPPPFRPPRGGPHNMFPKCKDFMKEVHDKLRENGSGPRSCRNAQDYDDCKWQELMNARKNVNSKPSKECMDQVHKFMNGTPDDGKSEE
ncbi:uncharacterized protein LOC129988874 [Argiope bruennichi]|uniref:Uncharacterized protein n=1 Tax=Argiope bruennichi TaxID=94029 RepID=A0A8T0EAR6_ARGBR|nr:uncharacterized protein LOC129988874 [Argiope bruennichi]KAF8769857.1 hypothetical protein HNY73_017456 [Argiope bruennichi]